MMVMVWVYVMPQIPETWGHAHSSSNRVNVIRFTMAVLLVWNRSIGTIPQSYGTSQLPGGRSGLFDEVDGNRSPNKDHGEEHMEHVLSSK